MGPLTGIQCQAGDICVRRADGCFRRSLTQQALCSGPLSHTHTPCQQPQQLRPENLNVPTMACVCVCVCVCVLRNTEKGCQLLGLVNNPPILIFFGVNLSHVGGYVGRRGPMCVFVCV